METAPGGGGPRLLLVEDDMAVALLLQETFGDHGFVVSFADCGAAAMRLLDDGGFDVVVTDINLGPGPDGFDVSHHARERHGPIPVIYVTGQAEADFARRGVAGSTLTPKPFVPEALARQVLKRLDAW
jgi:CheY-like chemotaxis protein